MTLAPGARLGPHEITAKLGEGGMGVVWRARDTKLGREVAIKVLPQAFTQDAERLARFEREAKVLASLNHPNIAAIHGLEEQGGVRALVMELVEGPTLAERMTEGPLPLDETLSVFRQIAEALGSAHAQGIVHRDLKPQNIKLRADGTVKVLDFGLAKMSELAGTSSPSNLTHSPTMTTPHGTAAGLILGTAAYMSPEQARGKAVDKRSDIWAFGVVMYECLSGRALFQGETITDTLAAVLRAEVNWSQLPAALPVSLRNLLRRCLERDPRSRLHDVADARIVLDEILSGKHEAAAAAAPAVAPRRRPGLLIAFGFALGALVGAAGLWLSSSARPQPQQFPSVAPAVFRQLTMLPGGENLPAIAPDGQSFAYVKRVGGQADIFVQRVLGQNATNVTAGCAEDDTDPAFSPDGQRIAFHSGCAGGGLFVMGASGESARKVTDFGFSPAWSPDGREVAVVTERLVLPWGRTSESELWAVSVETGERRRVSEGDAMQPAWSPDGRRIAFWGLRGETSNRDLWTVAADGSERPAEAAVTVTDDPHLDWSPVWSADGRALHFSSTRGGTMNLWRIAVDPASGKPQGAPFPLTAPSSWVGWISLSRDGQRLVFVDRNAHTTLRRAPFDPQQGQLAGPPQVIPLGTLELYDVFELAPDGESVLFSNAGLPQHLFVARADGSDLRQLTEGPHRDRQGALSPDMQWIAFQTTRWPSNLALIHPDGSGLRPAVSDRMDGWNPRWSPDGTRIALSSAAGAYLLDARAATPAGSTRSLPVPENGLHFEPTAWSEDGRELAGWLRSPSGASAGLAILSLADSTYRELSAVAKPLGARFLPDGRTLVVGVEDRLVLLEPRSGVLREIVRATPGHSMANLSLSHDGRWLAWLETADESDIWMAEFDGRR